MTTFDELSADRRAYVHWARKNGFEEGLRNLLSDLYPDNAHFIYELLQNAEDAGAREVTFDLRSDGLRVEHDGSRLFGLRDIDSITGIGQSTKKDDATTIGKFGVGFKAVFAYTQTPVIHSGNHSFAIHDLFIPVPVAAAAHRGRTTFWFPFDRADKPAQRAVKEVAHALRMLSSTTLLFLNNIERIACSLPGDEAVLLERVALDEHVIKIVGAHEDRRASYWYRITGDIEVAGKVCPVAAAFALDATSTEPTVSSKFSVKPAKGRVYIYFPAAKETSGLRFHIHAPFASTVARDSVRDDPGNDELLNGIGELIARALPAMRDDGLITDGLLSALPNDRDDLPGRYVVLRERIVDAFDSEPVTPVAGGGHARAGLLLRSSHAAIRNALSIEDANFIRGFAYEDDEPPVGWLRSADGRAGTFLNSLPAIDFGRDELLEVFEVVSGPGVVEPSWFVWISAKTDGWLRELYVALGVLSQEDASDPFAMRELRNVLGAAPLIRVWQGNDIDHIAGSNAYLPTAPDLRADRLVIDPLVIFDDEGRSKTREHRFLRQFYEIAGVRPWDQAAQLDIRLSNYRTQAASVTEDHLADLSALKELIDRRAVTPGTYAGMPIFVAVRHDGTRHWASARATYLDDPFVATGLTALYQSREYRDKPPSLLAPEYAKRSFDVAALAKTLEAISDLNVIRVPIGKNPKFEYSWHWDGRENHNMVDRDWVIPHFHAIVSTEDEALLRTLWRVVTTTDGACGDAVYPGGFQSP
ncbi:hypothetical protein AB0M46_24315 [Dactylosporangium sp. NPDC051485]|uniref:sacsin N-terminal ATP-binding-like domain-containing protein n=1 Tax=Dactylosporangium sp. NPDC051485 TaxID=3154846 RepID=UPI00341E707B